ncbi:Hypothetical predicted protein [Cloeon dipterum]|uniref:Uncharacterized protein n=1 Tax=Cloeon dipterum TaxID=197152 RepID=A0A8S1D591_9INSE|nr:Hypothetical predicted protein [Cloeon dipterum]
MVMDENGLPPPVPRELYLQEYHGFLASSAGSDLSYENFMKFIRALVKYMASSKTVEILSSYFDKNVITSINLEDFSSLYPSEPDFLLGVLHNLNHADTANAEKFPRVTSLSLNWKKVDNFFNCVNWVSLEKFTKLIHVQNYDLNPNHIATFCFKFGAILESLHFGYTTKNRFKINMLVIKDDCPKLKKLEIVGTGVDDRYSLESFASLLDLRITFQTNVRKEVKLSKLLAAPNLKIVKLSDFRASNFSIPTKFKMSGNDSNHEVERSPALRSLQDSAINTIVKNIGGYRDLITKIIAPPMRKILFDEAMKRIKEIGADQVLAALPFLDQQRSTEIFSTKDFATIFRLKGVRGGFSEGCVSIEEFLQHLVVYVPNLQQLNIEDPRMSDSFYDMYMFKEAQLEPLATDLLLQLENLTHVSIIDVYIQFSGFVNVCRESPNLHSIEANNVLVDKESNSIKTSLKTLESKFDHQEYNALNYPRIIGITLKKAKADKPYRQAKVSLSNDLDDIFPSLTQLEIWTLRDKDLGVDDIQRKRNHLLGILRRVGGTLNTLILEYIRPEWNLTFKQIFEHCSDLETLDLRHSNVSDDEPIASFGQLKNFKWLETFDEEGTIRLDRVFSAPLLKNIDIFAFKFNLDDKVSLLKRIRNRKIFTQLTYFSILGLKEYNEEDLDDLASELRSRGVEVYRTEMDSSDDDLWIDQLMQEGHALH